MSDEILNKLKAFIFSQVFGYTLSFQLLFKKKEITRDTAIEKGLGITGDDAGEFLIAFGKEFNVDIRQFPISDYFNDEGDPILPAIISFLHGRKKRERKVLTVEHLEKAVIFGRLDEEIINR